MAVVLLLYVRLILSFQFDITKQWDGRPTGHEPISITLTPATSGLDLSVKAPFFNDPPNPGGTKGQPFHSLWDFEVVEAFFLADDRKYLEVELCPHGQHLVLLLNGQRHMIKECLPLKFECETEGGSWHGTAHIPWHYFPAAVTQFNAYAIHGSAEKRMYEALYPAPLGKHEAPDFHRLEYFHPAEFADLLPKSWTPEADELWGRR